MSCYLHLLVPIVNTVQSDDPIREPNHKERLPVTHAQTRKPPATSTVDNCTSLSPAVLAYPGSLMTSLLSALMTGFDHTIIIPDSSLLATCTERGKHTHIIIMVESSHQFEFKVLPTLGKTYIQ